jgi:hypothetical protein
LPVRVVVEAYRRASKIIEAIMLNQTKVEGAGTGDSGMVILARELRSGAGTKTRKEKSCLKICAYCLP